MMKIKKRHTIRLFFLFIFRPKEFVRTAEEFAKQQGSESKSGENKKAQSFSARQTNYLRQALGKSFGLVFGVILAGSLSGILLNELCGPAGKWPARIILYSGIAILLWTTLGKGGWSIRSYSGSTLPEQVDDLIFRILHLLGSYMLVLAATWQVAAVLG
ncbi:MAG TPA: hypothetical protein ENH23_02150 [candidate division Zixibacteria bacterium]|nr:hypothetical protein [candidate division Zixibacteria bacterium]